LAAATTTFAALLQLAVADVADVDEKERAQHAGCFAGEGVALQLAAAPLQSAG